ncbi:hypothetical protein [Nocardia sp. NPDC050406]|uniref:hypothetical protein n=1 Tax=Nocardia sp. NPDC050406 TaxID=3364318 RepID=UPI00378C23CD
MTNSDDHKDEGTQRNPEWWEGVPDAATPPPADPTVVRGAYPPGYGPAGPNPVQPYPGGPYQPGPTPQPGYPPQLGSMPQQQQSGPTPQQSGPMPHQPGPIPQPGPTPQQPGPISQPGPLPQQSGSTPQQSGPTPQQSGPMPLQSGHQPYPVGANPYQSGQNPYQSGPMAYQSSHSHPAAQPPYGGPPQYGPPTGGGDNRKALLIGGAAVAVVLLVAVVAVVLVNRGPDTPIADPTTTPSSTSATATTTKTTTTPRTPTAQIPGYQVVVPDNIGAAWEVPGDWIRDISVTEFGSGADVVPVAGLTTEGARYCTDFVRTNMWLSATQNADSTASAREIGERVARIGWSTGSGGTPGPAEPFTTSDGNLSGTFMETKGTFTSSDPRCAKTFSVYTFAVSGGASSSLVLTIAADTGVDRSVDAAFAKKLMATFRLI